MTTARIIGLVLPATGLIALIGFAIAAWADARGNRDKKK